METVIVEGNPYYKVEFHARYSDADEGQGEVGVKVTGVYFATALTDDAGAAATPQLVHNPTVVPPAGSTSESTQETGPADATARADSAMKRTEQAEAAAIAQAEAATATHQAMATPTKAATPTQTPTERVLPTPTASPVPEPPGISGDMGTGFLYGIIAAAALIGLFLAVRFLMRKS